MNQVTEFKTHSLTIPKPIPVRKPEPQWQHIVGVHVEKNAELAAVWLGHDPHGDRITVYDSVLYPRGTHFAVIADDIKRRGGWKPIAWRSHDEEYINALKERGCKVLSFSKKTPVYDETPEICAANALKIDERLTTGGFVVWDTSINWIREYESFGPKDGEIPQEGFPLMSATRHAFHYLKRAAKWPDGRRPVKYITQGIV